jgi:hypothetical protein
VPYWDIRAHGTIVDGATFEHVTELVTRQAVRLQHPVSVLTLEPSGRGADDPGTAERFARELAEALSPLIRSTDVIGVTGEVGRLRLLLVGSDVEGLATIVRRILVEIGFHAFGGAPVTLSIGGSCFPSTADGTRALLDEADALAESVRRDRPSDSAYRLPTRS